MESLANDDRGKARSRFRNLAIEGDAWLAAACLLVAPSRPGLLIFAFHGLFESAEEIAVGAADPQQAMTTSMFRAFLEHFVTMTTASFLPVEAAAGLDPAGKYAMISFDDGYANNRRACRRWKNSSVPALFSISVNHVRTGKPFWWDVLYREARERGWSEARLDGARRRSSACAPAKSSSGWLPSSERMAFQTVSDTDRPLRRTNSPRSRAILWCTLETTPATTPFSRTIPLPDACDEIGRAQDWLRGNLRQDPAGNRVSEWQCVAAGFARGSGCRAFLLGLTGQPGRNPTASTRWQQERVAAQAAHALGFAGHRGAVPCGAVSFFAAGGVRGYAFEVAGLRTRPKYDHVRHDRQQQLRILQVHDSYAPGWGGEDTVVELERRMLRERGHAVEQFRTSHAGLKICRGAPAVAGRARLFLVAPCLSGAARKIADFPPDIVHVHNTFPQLSPSVFWAAQRAGVPVIQTLHNFRHVCADSTLLRDGKPCQRCVGRPPWRGAALWLLRRKPGAHGCRGCGQSRCIRQLGTYPAAWTASSPSTASAGKFSGARTFPAQTFPKTGWLRRRTLCLSRPWAPHRENSKPSLSERSARARAFLCCSTPGGAPVLRVEALAHRRRPGTRISRHGMRAPARHRVVRKARPRPGSRACRRQPRAWCFLRLLMRTARWQCSKPCRWEHRSSPLISPACRPMIRNESRGLAVSARARGSRSPPRLYPAPGSTDENWAVQSNAARQAHAERYSEDANYSATDFHLSNRDRAAPCPWRRLHAPHSRIRKTPFELSPPFHKSQGR